MLKVLNNDFLYEKDMHDIYSYFITFFLFILLCSTSFGEEVHEDDDPEVLFEVDNTDEEQDEASNDDDEPDVDEPPKKKKAKTVQTRQRWSKDEEAEIQKYFQQYLDTSTTPNGRACNKAKENSLQNGGHIHRRANHLIVKKISAMNHKPKQRH